MAQIPKFNLNKVYVAILAGGGGTRLWPKSRRKTPKHLLRLVSEKTMLEETILRTLPLIPKERIFIVVIQDHLSQVRKLFPDFPLKNLLVEPEGKNTAMAMGLAALWIQRQDPEAVIINLAADHLVKNQEEYRKTLKVAAQAANLGDYLVAIGISPRFPHAGLGYIRVDGEVARIERIPIFKVIGFTEKPNLTTAQAFLASGEYFWNANLYTWKASSILAAFKTLAPNLWQNLARIQKALGGPREKPTLKKVYGKVDSVQIDYAVSEKATNMLMVPGDFGWNDVGNWAVLHEVSEPVLEGNVVIGGKKADHISLGTKGCLIHSNGRLVVTIGLSEMIIIDTPDVLLICPKSKAQEVKKIVELLKSQKRHEYL